jgi:hypothetical protein
LTENGYMVTAVTVRNSSPDNPKKLSIALFVT